MTLGLEYLICFCFSRWIFNRNLSCQSLYTAYLIQRENGWRLLHFHAYICSQIIGISAIDSFVSFQCKLRIWLTQEIICFDWNGEGLLHACISSIVMCFNRHTFLLPPLISKVILPPLKTAPILFVGWYLFWSGSICKSEEIFYVFYPFRLMMVMIQVIMK